MIAKFSILSTAQNTLTVHPTKACHSILRVLTSLDTPACRGLRDGRVAPRPRSSVWPSRARTRAVPTGLAGSVPRRGVRCRRPPPSITPPPRLLSYTLPVDAPRPVGTPRSRLHQPASALRMRVLHTRCSALAARSAASCASAWITAAATSYTKRSWLATVTRVEAKKKLAFSSR